MSDDRNYQVLEHLDARPLRGRRGWSPDAKARLIEESMAPGANVSAIARRVGISPSQLFGWRRQAVESGAVSGVGTDEALSFARVCAPSASVIEIALNGVVIKVGADIEMAHLATVLRAVRGR